MLFNVINPEWIILYFIKTLCLLLIAAVYPLLQLVDLINPYAVVATQQVYPTGPVNGLLTSGDIKVGTRGPATVYTYGGLLGPLVDKPVTALDDVIKSKNAYITVRTLDHQTGEIQGQILPTSSSVSCLTTARFGLPTTTPNVNNSLY